MRCQRRAELIQGGGVELPGGPIGTVAVPGLTWRLVNVWLTVHGDAAGDRLAAVGDGGGERVNAGLDEADGRVLGGLAPLAENVTPAGPLPDQVYVKPLSLPFS